MQLPTSCKSWSGSFQTLVTQRNDVPSKLEIAVLGAGAQVNQHQLLVHALVKLSKRLGITTTVKGGDLSTADRDYLIDIVILAGDTTYASSFLIDVTPADPQSADISSAGALL